MKTVFNDKFQLTLVERTVLIYLKTMSPGFNPDSNIIASDLALNITTVNDAIDRLKLFQII